jgi:hypothetical protein
MEQINIEHVYAPECVEFEICLEEFIKDEKKHEDQRNIIEKGKKSTLKLVKKAELNAKYFDELKTIKLVRTQTNYRRYGVF